MLNSFHTHKHTYTLGQGRAAQHELKLDYLAIIAWICKRKDYLSTKIPTDSSSIHAHIHTHIRTQTTCSLYSVSHTQYLVTKAWQYGSSPTLLLSCSPALLLSYLLFHPLIPHLLNLRPPKPPPPYHILNTNALNGLFLALSVTEIATATLRLSFI